MDLEDPEPGYWRTESPRQLPLSDAERVEELFAEHLSWMGGGSAGWNADRLTSVVGDNLNIDRTRFRPSETEPTLLVDPDAVLPSAISPECLESVPWWYPQVVQDLGLIEGIESSGGPLQGDRGDALPSRFGVPTVEQVVGRLMGIGMAKPIRSGAGAVAFCGSAVGWGFGQV